MGFNYAGNLGGAGAPVVRRLQTAQDLYVGNLVQTNMFGVSEGGHVELADVATEVFENDQPIVGFVSAIADESRAYVAASSGTAGYGDKSTYTTTQATIAANQGTGLTGGGEVDVTLALPMTTLIRAPIYNTVWGTALTEQVVTTASSTGVTITAAGDAITDIADGFATAYCRSGANRGQYRVVTTTTSTTVNTVVIPFPYGIVVGDVFVIASCKLGIGGMDLCTAADAIDGNNDMDKFYAVYYHEINLEESGKEYAIFAMAPQWISAA
jgi:hypothetical protein